jgi:hypothetical protein
MAGIALPYPRLRTRAHFPSRSIPALAPVSERLVLWIGGGLLFITAVLNFYVFQVSVVATSAYEVQALDRERDVWKARNQQLHLELSKAQSLRWVEYDASQRLGMVGGSGTVFLTVETREGRATETPPAASGSTLEPTDSGPIGFSWPWTTPSAAP